MFLSEIIYILGCEYFIKDKRIKEIKIDSRNLNKGDLFICINNGHNYIEEAVRKKVSAIIVDRDIEYDIDIPIIKVGNTIKALGIISSYIRNKYNGIVIAITGSNGKTTTKELLSFILNNYGKVLKNIGTENNHIGVPKALLKLNNSYNYVVLELGTNHIGEIEYLTNIVKPDYAIITNIGTNHIGYFKSKKNIFKEKISISNKNLIVCGDDKYLKKLNAYKCGINKNNDLIAYDIYEGIDYITFNIYLDKEYKIVFNNPGKHFISDILLAIKVCLDYKIDIDTIIDRISSFKLINKRMTIIKSNNNIIINDCYNASLESIKSGIEYMNNIKEDKVFIIGDILELGKHSKRIHKKINKLLKKENVYTVGNYSKYIKGNPFNNVDELINYLNINKIENKYIYIKGSRRMNLDKIVEYLKK